MTDKEKEQQKQAENKFLIFGQSMQEVDTLNDEQYKDDKTRISGNTKGIARRNPINKALHQATKMAHVIADVIKDKTNKDVTDNLESEELKKGFTTVITNISTDVTNNIISGGGNGGDGQGALNDLLHKSGKENITGEKIFNVTPKITTAITDPQHATTKGAVDKITGDLSQLVTDAKGNLVEAINEIKTHGGGGSGGGSDSGYIVKPKILEPTQGQTEVSVSFKLKGGPYRTIINDNPRKERIFQVSTSKNFDERLTKTMKANADEVTFTELLVETTKYYARIQDVSNEFTSAYSDVVEFTTGGAISIIPPTVTVQGEPDQVSKTPTIQGSAFSVSLGSADTHEMTDWALYNKTDTNTVLWSSLNNTTNKTSITIPEGQLITNTSYIVKVRYKGTKYGWSDYGQKEFKTKVTFNTFQDPQVADTIPYANNMKPPFIVHITPMLDTNGNVSKDIYHEKTEWALYEEGIDTPIKNYTMTSRNKLKMFFDQDDGLQPIKKYYVKFRCYNSSQQSWSEWARTETITMASDFTPCFAIKVKAKDNFTINLKNAFGATPKQRPIYDLNRSSIGGGNGCYLFGEITELNYTISIDNGAFTNNFDQVLTMTKGQEKIIRIKGDPRYEYRMLPVFFYQDELDYKDGAGFIVNGESSYKTKEQVQTDIINNYILFFDSIVELLEPLPPPLLIDHGVGNEEARVGNNRSSFAISLPLNKNQNSNNIKEIKNTRKGFFRNMNFSNTVNGYSYFNYNPCFVIPYGSFDSMLMKIDYNLYTKFNILQNVKPESCHDMYKNSYKNYFTYVYDHLSFSIDSIHEINSIFTVFIQKTSMSIKDKIFRTLDNKTTIDFALLTKNQLFKDGNSTRLVKNLFHYYGLKERRNESNINYNEIYLQSNYVLAQEGLNIKDLVYKFTDFNSLIVTYFSTPNFYERNKENVVLKDMDKYPFVNFYARFMGFYDKLKDLSFMEVDYGFNKIKASWLLFRSDYTKNYGTSFNVQRLFRKNSNLIGIEGTLYPPELYFSNLINIYTLYFNYTFADLPLFNATIQFLNLPFQNYPFLSYFAQNSANVTVKIKRGNEKFKQSLENPSNNNNVNVVEV